MNERMLAFMIVALCLLSGAAGISAAVPGAGLIAGSEAAPAEAADPSLAPAGVPQAFLAPGPVWQQANSSGFGSLNATSVSALSSFNGQLYAGTHNAVDGALIYRSQDGTTWLPVIEPGFGIAHDIAPPAILDLTVFKGKLYASAGWGDGPGQIWRTLNGTAWAPMVIHGFSDPDNTSITTLVEYNGDLYAGVENQTTGAQIWRSTSGDNNSWTKVAPAAPGMATAGVTALAEFDGGLYAAVESESPAQIWRSFGGAWTVVVNDGFGSSQTTMTGGLAVFGGYLYAGAGNTTDGARLYRTVDGTTWNPAITPGFGDPKNQKVEAVFVYQNQLYISVSNSVTGMELWRSADGVQWDQANQDGFGDTGNTGTNWGNAVAGFFGDLYVGTSNPLGGGELWRLMQPRQNLYLPLIERE